MTGDPLRHSAYPFAAAAGGIVDIVGSMELIVALVSLAMVVVHFSLLSRVSHWAHQTQLKLDATNQRLAQIDQRLADGNRLTGHLVGRQ